MRLLLLFPILLSKGTSELSYDDCNYSLFCAYAIEDKERWWQFEQTTDSEITNSIGVGAAEDNYETNILIRCGTTGLNK